MLSEISARLTEVIEQRRRKEKIEQDLQQVQRSLEGKSRLLKTLGQQLAKEQVDVEKLERLSLTGMFYSVLGSREQQMEKERQELLAAELKYQQAKRLVDALRSDQAQLQEQLRGLQRVDAEYKSLLSAKERELRQANPGVASELIRLSEQIARRKADLHEIDEAMRAAQEVLPSLDQVIDSLNSAEGWGTWDLLGGGFLSTAIKHSRIDDARDAMQEVQARMSRFTRELADVQRSTDLTIEVGNLDIFADFFFDGLIVDWIVQSKINNSLRQAQLAREKIQAAAADLEKLRASQLGLLEHLSTQRDQTIERA